MLGRLALEFVLQHGKIRGAVGGRNDDLAVDDGGAGADVPGFVRDLLEALGPVVAAAGVDRHGFMDEMQLHPVAVELDLMDPAFAFRHLVDRRRQRRLDEAGVGRLDPDRRRFFRAGTPWSDQADRQPQLRNDAYANS